MWSSTFLPPSLKFGNLMMQEHLSTSASQPASHVKRMNSIAEKRRRPHFDLKIECKLNV
jgi:hypothetical protein